MSSIDHRIVEMKFNSKQFEEGVRRTTDSLAELENGLKLDNIADGVDSIGSKFSALNVIGATALGKLTSAAMDFGAKISGAVLDPLIEGGKKRAQNIELAEFQFEGLGMNVEKAMDSALSAVKGTAFGLDEAAVVAAQFGATGMKAGDEMASALRGVSGVAAMTGSSYSDVGNIFGKVAGQGRLMGDDLNRLAARGVNAAATLAAQWEISEEELRKMVSKGEVSFEDFANAMNEAFGEHATRANEMYSGSLANMRAAISRIGAEFASVKFEGLRRKFNALTPVIDAVADVMKPFVAIFEYWTDRSATKFESKMESLTTKIEAFAKPFSFLEFAGKNLIDAFDSMINPITNAFKAVFSGGKDIEETASKVQELILKFVAFTESLKRSEEQQAKIQKAFEAFFSVLKVGVGILKTIGNVLLEAAKWTGTLVSGLLGGVGSISELFSGLSGDSGGNFVDTLKAMADAIWDFSFNLDEARESVKGFMESMNEAAKIKFSQAAEKWQGFVESMSAAWEGLRNAVSQVWNFIKPIAQWIGEMVGIIAGGLKDAMANMDLERFLILVNTGVFATLSAGFYKLIKGASGIGSSISGFVGSASETLGALTDQLKMMQTEIKSKVLLNIAIAIGILAASIAILASIDPGNIGPATGAVVTMIAAVSGGMFLLSKVTMPKQLGKIAALSGVLIMLAGAVLILAAAAKIFSTMDVGELSRGLIGMGVAIGILVAAAAGLSKWTQDLGKIGIQLILLATSAVILAAAVKIFATMDLGSLTKGLVGMAVSLAVVVGALKLLGKDLPGMMAAAGAIITISVAMNLFAAAILAFGSMNTDTLIQGLAVLGGILLGLTAAITIMGQNAPMIIGAASAIMAIAVAMNLLIVPIAILGNMNLGTLAQGIIAMGVALAIIVVGVNALSGAATGAGSLVAVAAGLLVLSVAMKILGSMDIGQIGKALFAMAAALFIMGVAAYALAPVSPVLLAIGGAVALLGLGLVLASGAIMIFSLGLAMFGPAAIIAAGGIATLGLAAQKAVPALLPLLGLGAVLIVFGVGALAAGLGLAVMGVGLIAVGAGLAILAVTGAAGASALVLITNKLLELIPHVGDLTLLGLAVGILGAGLVILGAGLLIVAAAMLIFALAMDTSEDAVEKFMELMQRLVDMIPEMLEQIAEGIVGFAEIIEENADTIVGAGIALVENFIEGLIETIPLVVEAAVTLIMELLEGIQTVIPEVIETAVLLITEFLQGIQQVFPEVVNTAILLIQELLRGVRETVPDIVETAIFVVEELLQGLVSMTGVIVQAGFDMLIALLDGIADNIGEVADSATDVVIEFIEAIGRNGQKIVDAGFDTVIDFIEGVTKSVNDNMPKLQEAGRELAWALADGMTFGLAGKAREVKDAAMNVMSDAYNSVKNFFGIASPSKLFIELGEYTGEGMAIGLDNTRDDIVGTSENIGYNTLDALRHSLLGIPDVLEDIDWDADPVITPVLDLSDIERNARDISGMLAGGSVSPELNYGQAQGISAAEQARLLATVSAGSSETKGDVTFIQNNNSPKALTSAEIYRQTKNQISMLRGAPGNVRGAKNN